MIDKLSAGLLTALLVLARPALSSPTYVRVIDKSGRPLADAVIELSSDLPASVPDRRQPELEAIVDQRHETFQPFVSVVRKGGHVVFTNNDATMHQVYSFSPIKQFAFEIDEGQRSPPVVFNIAGVAAIGCNIHDRMIAYVYVASAPFAATSDAGGVASFGDLPRGNYRGTAWHPQLGTASQTFVLAVGEGSRTSTVTLPVNGSSASARKAVHMQMY